MSQIIPAPRRSRAPWSPTVAALAALAFASATALAADARAQEPRGGPPERPERQQPETETAPAPAAASADDAPVATARKPAKPPPPIGIRFDGGWSPHRLFSLPVNGADVGLGVGPRTSPHVAIWGTPRLFLGSTENGLSVWSAHIGAEVEGIIDRFRLGGGLGLFFLGVHRAVRNETLLSWGPDFRATTRFDIIQNEDFAIFARAQLDGGYEFFGESLFWGPTLGAGVELDVGVKRADASASSR
jgi:hypothetical protein